MSEYNDVRHNLIEMLEELDDRLAKITDDVRHADQEMEKDFAEQATQSENNEVLDALGNATRIEIAQVRRAINRIDNGDYGLCENCGQLIRPERLAALPFSCLCVACAEKAEQDRDHNGDGLV